MDILKLILTSFLSVISLFIITKILGHKQIAQLDFFDYVNGITIGSIAAELATELEKPWKPLVAMIIYGISAASLSLFANKFPSLRKFINGTPTIIMNNGKIYRRNMKKAKLDLSEFLVMCRQEGYFNLNDIKTAVFEYNGKLTILPFSTKRPLTPQDMNIIPPPDNICTEIIMDGKILEPNLKNLGLDLKWLKNELKVQNQNLKNISLAVCDADNNLTIFEQS